ncbi:hypothetical protein ACMT4L_07835 [Deinococcus sp. A31D244]|uniref:hypothetical protein n=1 Tax=Deinococcus sp. A31D244 TaxID=3397675 RepID=UPI0039E15893
MLPDALVGQLVTAGALPELIIQEQLRCMVITQDCDLVHHNFEAEPWCEVLLLRSIEEADGNFMWAKSGRMLHMSVPTVGEYECSIHDRHRIPRWYLVGHAPDTSMTLDPRTLNLLRQWLARRYARVALPDEFNRRVGSMQKKVMKALEKVGEDIQEVYLNTQFRELQADEEYLITLIGTMEDEVYEDTVKQAAVDAALSKAAGLLEKCHGVKAVDYEVRAREDVSLSEIDHLRRWDYLDPVSLSAEDE